ncbi:MAG: Txe/YoeB family addiction module toxin [Mycoplasmataceae bacterium]|jgi:toxin YoeB|nr:Txe/YoeB family addiction module toxin [Mycoplasmataceae bacterium]
MSNQMFHQVVFLAKALNDIKVYKSHSDKETIKYIWVLIKDIDVNGDLEGQGNPERLRRNFSGWYSRRINYFDRLIYKTNNDLIEILSCHGHYGELESYVN